MCLMATTAWDLVALVLMQWLQFHFASLKFINTKGAKPSAETQVLHKFKLFKFIANFYGIDSVVKSLIRNGDILALW